MRTNLSVGVVVSALATFGFAASVFAATSSHLGNFDFTAPVVATVSDVSDKAVGDIVYDSSSNSFKGYNGSWISLNPSPGTSYVSSAGANVRIEGAFVTNNGSTAAVVSGRSTSGWVTAASRSSLGVVNLTVTGFTQQPNCNCNPDPNVSIACVVVENSSSSFTVYTYNTTVSVDSNFDISCVGK